MKDTVSTHDQHLLPLLYLPSFIFLPKSKFTCYKMHSSFWEHETVAGKIVIEGPISETDKVIVRQGYFYVEAYVVRKN